MRKNNSMKLHCEKPRRSYLSNDQGKFKPPKEFKVWSGGCLVWVLSFNLLSRQTSALASCAGSELSNPEATCYLSEESTCHGPIKAGQGPLQLATAEDPTCPGLAATTGPELLSLACPADLLHTALVILLVVLS